jgi:hypothetical protein
MDPEVRALLEDIQLFLRNGMYATLVRAEDYQALLLRVNKALEKRMLR